MNTQKKSKVIISVGLPFSGKSTYATELIKNDSSYVEINRDNIRKKLFHVSGWSDYEITTERENLLIQVKILLLQIQICV